MWRLSDIPSLAVSFFMSNLCTHSMVFIQLGLSFRMTHFRLQLRHCLLHPLYYFGVRGWVCFEVNPWPAIKSTLV